VNAAVALRILAPRARALGTGDPDSLQNVNTHNLPEGSVCWVVDTAALYILQFGAANVPPNVAPGAGPGIWVPLSTGGGGTFYQTVEDEGSALPQEPILNFVGAGVSVADDPGGTRTNVTIPGGAAASIPMPDGTVALPQGANFTNELTLGWFRSASGFMGLAVANFLAAEFGQDPACSLFRLDTSNPAQEQLQLLEESDRVRFAVFTDGAAMLQGEVATGADGGVDHASPEFRLYGSVWDSVAASAKINGFVLKSIPNGGDDLSTLAFYNVTPLGTRLIAYIENDNSGDNNAHWFVGTTGQGQVRARVFQSSDLADIIINGGNLALRFATPSGANDTCLDELLLKDAANNFTSKAVAQGAADSAGVGFRALVVPNDAGDDTSVEAGDFALDAGWGVGASVSAVAAGSTCRRGACTITAAGTPAPGAVATLTFDTAFAATPFAIAVRTDGNNPPEVTSMSVKALASTTQLVLTLTGSSAPIAGTAYSFTWMVME